jgi:iron-sulfur cluster repair protein YtfE (RIC family)
VNKEGEVKYMQESVAAMVELIDKIVEEHRTALANLQSLENVANDVQAISGLEKTAETFMPDRLDETESLKKMQGLIEEIIEGLNSHFYREETRLLDGVEKYGDQRMSNALEMLLAQHKDLRDRFSKTQEHIIELIIGEMSRHRWRALAQDMRAYLAMTARELSAHAHSEQELLVSLRRQLVKT